MEGGRRSGDALPDYVVKNRNSSGCLILRKKGGDASGRRLNGCRPSGFGKGFDSREKRMRIEFTESSDELPLPVPGKYSPEPGKRRIGNGVSNFKGKDNVRGRKVKRREECMFGSERKRTRLDVFDFDEYDGNGVETSRGKQIKDHESQETGFYGSNIVEKAAFENDYEMRLRRHELEERKKNSFVADKKGSRNSIDLLRDRRGSDEPIRLQGRNGVLKVMMNKKISASSGGSSSFFDRSENSVGKKSPEAEEPIKRNVLSSVKSEIKTTAKRKSFSGAIKRFVNSSESSSERIARNYKAEVKDKKISVKKNVEGCKSVKKPMLSKNGVIEDTDSENSDTSLKMRQKRQVNNAGTVTCKDVPRNSSNISPVSMSKQGTVKRGAGTEKQKLRERIRQMLLDSGWTIEYRPRRNRDYLDAVYTSPVGTAYWSIIKAYDALLKQLHDDDEEVKPVDDASQFTPLPDELLNQLTRKTKNKMEKEMKKKKKENMESDKSRVKPMRRTSESVHDDESQEERLCSFIKSDGKPSKRLTATSSSSVSSKGQSSNHHILEDPKQPSSGCNPLQKRKSRKLGRCTLLARSSGGGPGSEINGFVPYPGKRTLLSWLIDCDSVQLSQKVLHMNRRRTKVMLEGWVTRDGIHCGCCSKILSVSKFEIHAGSKLRQPFQNICLESGVSLLDCQVDAWNQQKSDAKIGFHSVDVDSGDPNDDTCGLCGDGGDLMCCDGCPSTFHLSCLDFKTLPPGDWHCPNCACKYCGIASGKHAGNTDCMIISILTCNLCGKKYHKSCAVEKDRSVDCESKSGFCGRQCNELFGQLQKYVGVKHELEGGLSWTLIHRINSDSETNILGHSQTVECNSKLAVALLVMDECFLPIVDRRSGINIIHSVLYNCGSNFSRLNYAAFYAVILEKGDEIISAASIRFHGTRFAEMPFIGTRHVYRRQGMCRRLLNAIELVLLSLKVERLVIPAISEVKRTWTEVFGFTLLDKSLKQELKSYNMLVFPGVDMLEKQFLEPEEEEGYTTVESKKVGSKNVAKLQVGDNRHKETDVTKTVDLEKEVVVGVHLNTSTEVRIHSEHPNSECHEKFPSDKLLTSFVDKSSVEVVTKPLLLEGNEHDESETHLSENGSSVGQDCQRLKNADEESMPDIVSNNNHLKTHYGKFDNNPRTVSPSDDTEMTTSNDIYQKRGSPILKGDNSLPERSASFMTSHSEIVYAVTDEKREPFVTSCDLGSPTEADPNFGCSTDFSMVIGSLEACCQKNELDIHSNGGKS